MEEIAVRLVGIVAREKMSSLLDRSLPIPEADSQSLLTLLGTIVLLRVPLSIPGPAWKAASRITGCTMQLSS